MAPPLAKTPLSMANVNNAAIAAVKVQAAWRGARARREVRTSFLLKQETQRLELETSYDRRSLKEHPGRRMRTGLFGGEKQAACGKYGPSNSVTTTLAQEEDVEPDLDDTPHVGRKGVKSLAVAFEARKAKRSMNLNA